MGKDKEAPEEPEEEEAPEEEPSEPKKTPSMIFEAKEQADRLEKANKEMRELLIKQEELLAEGRLQGRAIAGQPQQKKVETDEEYAWGALSGNFKNEGQK